MFTQELGRSNSSRGRGSYSSAFSLHFVSNALILTVAFVHALAVAHHYVEIDAHRASNGIVAAIMLGIFFLGVCLHRWRIRQLLRTHPTDEAILSEMNSMVAKATYGFCTLTILILHPIV